jgi:hypothetical protein
MLKTALAKIATAKAALVLAAVGGGGVALAAGSGHLPGVGAPDQHAGDRATTSVSGSAHASSGHGAANAAAHGSGAAAAATPAGRAATPNGSPSPNLRGLCTAYSAGVAANPGKALANPAFTVLITTAGGKDQVAGYCTTLLATPAGAAASSHPGSAADPQPSTRVSHPTGPEDTPSHPNPAPTNTHSH